MKQALTLLLSLSFFTSISIASNPNKESFTLLKENFANPECINSEGLQEQLIASFEVKSHQDGSVL